MRRILLVTLSLPLFSLSAMAQNAANTPVAAPMAPASSPLVPAASEPVVNPSSMMPTTMTPAPNPYSATKPSATTSTVGSGAPTAGANSFTESQAIARLEQSGFTSVSGLKKDDNGIWKGSAQRNGKTVSVSLDYKGEITTR